MPCAGSGRDSGEGDDGQNAAVVVAVRRQAELVEDRGCEEASLHWPGRQTRSALASVLRRHSGDSGEEEGLDCSTRPVRTTPHGPDPQQHIVRAVCVVIRLTSRVGIVSCCYDRSGKEKE